MPDRDLSLFGYLKKAEAEQYLKDNCVLHPGDDPAEMWRAARTRLGPPFPNPGCPEVKEIPRGHARYLRGVETNPRFADTVRELPSWSFKLVEIEPLLAYQLGIFRRHSDALCKDMTSGDPTMDQLLTVCLPHDAEHVPVDRSETGNSLTLQSKTLNLRFFESGYADDGDGRTVFGPALGAASPLVQVLQHNGRCYLANGFHRVYGARRRGATHVPCIFAETKDFARTGAAQPGVLPLSLLEARNAPTLGHFANGRATEVTLRRFGRVVTVSWTVSHVELTSP